MNQLHIVQPDLSITDTANEDANCDEIVQATCVQCGKMSEIPAAQAANLANSNVANVCAFTRSGGCASELRRKRHQKYVSPFALSCSHGSLWRPETLSIPFETSSKMMRVDVEISSYDELQGEISWIKGVSGEQTGGPPPLSQFGAPCRPGGERFAPHPT